MTTEPHENGKNGLWAALMAAQNKIEPVAHDARNEFSNFDYTSAEAILMASRKALLESGLVARRGSWDIGEGEQPLVAMHFYLIHPESGESMEEKVYFPAVPGKGRPIDKAIAGALTTGFAYWLRDLLMIPRCETEMDNRPGGDDDTPKGKGRNTFNGNGANGGDPLATQGGGNGSSGQKQSGHFRGVITGVEKEQKTGKRGEFTVYRITSDANGRTGTIDTIDNETGQKAEQLKGTGQEVTIRWKLKPNGYKEISKIEDTQPASPQGEPGEDRGEGEG